MPPPTPTQDPYAEIAIGNDDPYSQIAKPVNGNAPKPASAASRFTSSAARGVGMVSPEEGKNFFKHPIDTLKGMGEAQADVGRRAGREFKSGDYIGAATHGIEYLLPGIGPALAHSGDQLESGDIAGGIGTMAGVGGGIVAGSKIGTPKPIASMGKGGPATMGVPKAPSSLRSMAIGDPNAAISKSLHVPAKSPEMAATVEEVEGARPYLKGAKSQADVQSKLPGAKAEVWEPYNKAVELIGDRTVSGPDGPTTIRDLESQRLKLSAELQIAQKARPTDTQTAIQAEKQIADMKDRYQAITSALDPELSKTGIDPVAIRRTHGQLKGVERNVSGKSTVTEEKQPYGIRKMIPTRVPNPLGSEWKWQPVQGVKDIAAGRPMWSGKPTDVAMKDLFSKGGAKPDLGTPITPRIAGLLPAGAREMGSSMEPLGEPTPPPPIAMGTRAERLGLMLPEPKQPLLDQGYNSPAGPGEILPPSKFRPGKHIGEVRNGRWWDGEKWRLDKKR